MLHQHNHWVRVITQSAPAGTEHVQLIIRGDAGATCMLCVPVCVVKDRL